MYLARVEEALDFDSSIFDRVGGVADVFHAGGANVAADGAGGDGAGAHEFNNLRKEWPIGDVRVVFLEEVIGEGDELGGADFEAGFFKPADDFACVMAVEAVRFEQYE